MKTQIILITMVTLSNALLAERWVPCCFCLSASGDVSGTIGQLGDGQNRIGGPLEPAQFCIADGIIKDSQGRGCIVTPPTSQIQCDQGAPGDSGFGITCDGTVTYLGSPNFWECQTGENGESNIYVTPGGTNCGPITLKASSCMPGCEKTCPNTLGAPGTYEFPHLIIPIDSSQPDTAPGTSYFGTISSTISSIFNFDILASDAGKTCSLIFLLPTQAQLQTSSFTLSGNGGLDFERLGSAATQGTTFRNAPAVQTDYGVVNVSPGNSYTIATFPCPAGQTIAFEIRASGNTQLRYFQDYNPSPIGLYITKC